MKNMIIGQSGGPSPAINASLAGAVRRAMASNDKIGKVYGMVHGLEGLLQRKIICLSDQMDSAEKFDLLAHTPAMALGSCRFKLKKDNTKAFEDVLRIFREYNIGYFFYCGGNDSMDTINTLSAYFRENGEDIVCVGIPKTVDNDLAVTDHTPGFGSAARFVAISCAEIMIDAYAYPQPSVTVVEIMGRNAGWLTAASVIARRGGFGGPHIILLPESLFDPEVFIKRVGELLETEQHILVAVSEGIKWKHNGQYVSLKDGAVVDQFGHAKLGGVAEVLQAIVEENYGKAKRPDAPVKGRSVEPSVMQRVGSHLASGVDLTEARELGNLAVEVALSAKEKGERADVMVGIERISNTPYLTRYIQIPLDQVANHERVVPAEWISREGTDVTQEVVDYMLPLFRGQTDIAYEDGLPKFLCLDRKKLVKPE